jgi:5-methyltetrahydrofolate--homocysteine methyltransferase
MGVMVPTDKIIAEAIRIKADILGLSGLITPSLEEMAGVASEMEKNNLKIPLLIGGATTSKIHTAVKIEPSYSGAVVHVKDASKSVGVVNSLVSADNKDKFIADVRAEYDALRKSYASAKSTVDYLSLDEARKNKFETDWNQSKIVKPSFIGTRTFNDFSIAEIREYINWVFFFLVWQLKGKYPDILKDAVVGEEARKLFDDANKMLDQIEKEKLIVANGIVGFYPANSVGDDIEVYDDESRKKLLVTFRNLRNQTKHNDETPNYCLSDFIAPKESGITDYMGAFAVTAGMGMEKFLDVLKSKNDDYNSILIKSLADRLAEAFTELIHEKIRKELWGYNKDENMSKDEMFLEKYKGIRPAHGYPACPDHSEKSTLWELLDVEKYTGIQLTETNSMFPAASVSGLLFAHPKSLYFYVGKLGEDQVKDYANRKKFDVPTVEKWLASNLNYK